MSFRGGRGGGGNRGGRGGGGGYGGRGGRGGGGRGNFDQGPPEYVVEAGIFVHPVENDLVITNTTEKKVPFFNAVIYFENIEPLGKVDEIFGNPEKSGFTVKLNEGIKVHSFKKDQKVYIDPAKLLPVERFTNPAKPGGRGRGGGGDRGGRGGDRGGRGGRGGFGGGYRGGRGGGRGGDRGGRGGYNNDRGSRGGYNNDRGSRGGYNNDRGSRGGYNNDRGGRGGYNNDRGYGKRSFDGGAQGGKRPRFE